MKVIVNVTPLISLGLINHLSLLPSLFDEVLTPPAVYDEVVKQREERPAATAVRMTPWLRVQAPKTFTTIEPLLLGLDRGETEVLLLALEVKPDKAETWRFARQPVIITGRQDSDAR